MLIPARRRCGSPGPADHHLPLTRLEHGVDHPVYQRIVCTSGWRGCTRCPPRAPSRTTCDSTSFGPATLLATQPGVLLGANPTRARWPARPQSNRSAIVGYDAQEACTTVSRTSRSCFRRSGRADQWILTGYSGTTCTVPSSRTTDSAADEHPLAGDVTITPTSSPGYPADTSRRAS